MSRVLDVSLPPWAEPLLTPATYKSLRGGRCSCKSQTFARLSVLRMANLVPGYPRQPVSIISARDFNTTLKHSVKKAVVNAIDGYGLSKHFRVLTTEIRHRNGSTMTFTGVARDPGGLMSVEEIDVFWMEQAEVLEAGEGSAMSVIEPSIRKEPHEFWFSWNPLSRDGWCWHRFVRNPQEGDISLFVNWEDNPWWDELPSMQKLRIYDKKYEPQLYEWKWGGLPLDGDAEYRVPAPRAAGEVRGSLRAGLGARHHRRALHACGDGLGRRRSEPVRPGHQGGSDSPRGVEMARGRARPSTGRRGKHGGTQPPMTPCGSTTTRPPTRWKP